MYYKLGYQMLNLIYEKSQSWCDNKLKTISYHRTKNLNTN